MENNIRLGKISSVDYATGMVRVVYHDKDDSVTRLVPTLSHEYHMPQVGDQVLVLHLSNGTEAAVVLGRPWSDKNRPPESGAGLYRKDLGQAPGEAVIRYKGGTLTITAGGVEVNGSMEATGGLTVRGSLEASGDVVITGNLTMGGSLTVAGSITAQGVAASGDVVAGGVSLQNHTHTDSVGGGTTPPG